ncbi:hypothetical protein [Lentzea sp. NPDC060358]
MTAGSGRAVVVREDAVPAFAGHAGGVADLAVHGTVAASAGDDGPVRL